jgi:hypothetical protein
MKLEQLKEETSKKAGDLIISNQRLGDVETWNGKLNLNTAFITSLEGCPREINGDFICIFNPELRSLKGGPEKVTKMCKIFDCSNNSLKSLEGCPKIIEGKFKCLNNTLPSLVGGPEICKGDFYCSTNWITSLEGCPKEIGGYFFLEHNRITNLHNIHHHLRRCNGIVLSQNPIKSHILGLLKIEDLNEATFTDIRLSSIISKYLPMGDVIDCQDELIEAGYEEFAQL